MRSPLRTGIAGLSVLASALATVPDARADTRACVEAAARAQQKRDEGHLRAARDDLLQCVVETCPAVVRNDCGVWLTDVDQRIPSVLLGAHDALGNDVGEVRVLIDGSPLVGRLDGKAVAVDPGEHTFRFVPPVGTPVERRVIVRERERGRLVSVELPRGSGEPAGRPLPAATKPPGEGDHGRRSIPAISYVLGGVSLVGVAGFAYFWLSAVSDAKDLQQTCAARGCVESDLSPSRTKAMLADISLGVGVAAALGAAAFFVFQKRSTAVSLGGLSSREGVGMSVSQAF